MRKNIKIAYILAMILLILIVVYIGIKLLISTKENGVSGTYISKDSGQTLSIEIDLEKNHFWVYDMKSSFSNNGISGTVEKKGNMLMLQADGDECIYCFVIGDKEIYFDLQNSVSSVVKTEYMEVTFKDKETFVNISE